MSLRLLICLVQLLITLGYSSEQFQFKHGSRRSSTYTTNGGRSLCFHGLPIWRNRERFPSPQILVLHRPTLPEKVHVLTDKPVLHALVHLLVVLAVPRRQVLVDCIAEIMLRDGEVLVALWILA